MTPIIHGRLADDTRLTCGWPSAGDWSARSRWPALRWMADRAVRQFRRPVAVAPPAVAAPAAVVAWRSSPGAVRGGGSAAAVAPPAVAAPPAAPAAAPPGMAAAAAMPSPTAGASVRAAVAAPAAAAVAATGAKSNRRPSSLRRNRTGVAHSVSLTSVKTALRASATATSIGSWRAISDWYNSPAKVIAALSEISNCIATTAGMPSATIGRRDPGERVNDAGPRAFARVEDDQPGASPGRPAG